MLATQIIIKPLVTEKSTYLAGELNHVGFKVDLRATKPQIKKAVQDLYNVRVLGVSTQVCKGQLKRNRFGHWKTPTTKHAFVKIHPEDKIELF